MVNQSLLFKHILYDPHPLFFGSEKNIKGVLTYNTWVWELPLLA